MKTSCPRCGSIDEHEFVGSRWRGWLRCACGSSWQASLLASALARHPAVTNAPLKRVVPKTPLHDVHGIADDLESWLQSLEDQDCDGGQPQQRRHVVDLILANPFLAPHPVVEANPPSNGATRATRYLLRLPVEYRTKTAWCAGFTEDLSRTGLRFSAKDAERVVEQTTLQCRFRLPRLGSSLTSLSVHCSGTVVRVEPQDALRIQSAAVALSAWH